MYEFRQNSDHCCWQVLPKCSVHFVSLSSRAEALQNFSTAASLMVTHKPRRLGWFDTLLTSEYRPLFVWNLSHLRGTDRYWRSGCWVAFHRMRSGHRPLLLVRWRCSLCGRWDNLVFVFCICSFIIRASLIENANRNKTQQIFVIHWADVIITKTKLYVVFHYL